MDFQYLYRLADKFVGAQEAALRAITKSQPAPEARFAIREHLRAIEATLDKIEREGTTVPLDIPGRVRT